MRLVHCFVVSACLLLAAPNVVYAETPEEDGENAIVNWAKALGDGDVKTIVSYYAKEPNVLFFGTKSTKLAHTQAEIEDYFTHFVNDDHPWVALCNHDTIKVSDDAILFAGLHDFTSVGEWNVLHPARGGHHAYAAFFA